MSADSTAFINIAAAYINRFFIYKLVFGINKEID